MARVLPTLVPMTTEPKKYDRTFDSLGGSHYKLVASDVYKGHERRVWERTHPGEPGSSYCGSIDGRNPAYDGYRAGSAEDALKKLRAIIDDLEFEDEHLRTMISLAGSRPLAAGEVTDSTPLGSPVLVFSRGTTRAGVLRKVGPVNATVFYTSMGAIRAAHQVGALKPTITHKTSPRSEVLYIQTVV